MNINVCPSLLTPGYNCYSPVAARQLFGGVTVSPHLNIDLDKDVDSIKVTDNVGRISVSGAQEKMSAVIDNGTIRLTKSGERSTHILKPAPFDYDLSERRQMPANEHLTMQIASQAYGLSVASNGLCFDAKWRPVYITKRFDILSDGSKIEIEDFASLCGHNEQTEGKYFKYNGTYEDIAIAIKRHIAAWPVAIDRFFRLIIFDYIFCNGDAHMKNFSVMYHKDELRLTPAYDLLNTSLHLQGDDFGLTDGLMRSGWKSDIYTKTGHPCKDDFIKFGLQIGLSQRRTETIIQEYSTLPPTVYLLIERSFLNKKMKRKYMATISERTARFNRHS